MRISQRGIDFIKNWEKLRTETYPDQKGIPTIGYGHTRGVRPGMKINSKQAEDFLRQDLKRTENYIAKHVKADLNQNQYDALVSFVFNTGGLHNPIDPNTKKQTQTGVLTRLNNGDIEGAFNEELPRWIRTGGKVSRGLINRRNAEIALAMEKYLNNNPGKSAQYQNNRINEINNITPPQNTNPINQQNTGNPLSWLSGGF